MDIERVEEVLQTYSLSEILELNNIDEIDLLYFLVEQDYLELPDPEPL